MNQNLPTPGLGRRMACFLYESVILLGVGLISGSIGTLFTAWGGQELQHGAVAFQVIGFIVYGMYFIWFWSGHGQTLPMQTWHIRVVTNRGEPLTRKQALIRYVASWVWIAPAALVASFIGWTGWGVLAAIGVGIVVYALLTLFHPERQFWHDALCGTRLITAPSKPRPLTH